MERVYLVCPCVYEGSGYRICNYPIAIYKNEKDAEQFCRRNGLDIDSYYSPYHIEVEDLR